MLPQPDLINCHCTSVKLPIAPMTAAPEPPASQSPTVPVMLQLPRDLALLVSQRAKQQRRSPAEVLLEALRLAFTETTNPSAQTPDWQQMLDQLAKIEPLVSQVNELEAKIDRLLHTQTSAQPGPTARDRANPLPAESSASRQSQTGEGGDRCPNCQHRLGPPIKASGRRVCMQCGWSDKPRRAVAESTAVEPAPDEDLTSLLSQAAEQSLTNMQPKRSQPEPRGKHRFLPFK